MRENRRVRPWSGIALFLCLVPALVSAADSSRLHEPSGQQAWIPSPGDTFSTYVSNNEARIRAVLEQLYFADSAQADRGQGPLPQGGSSDCGSEPCSRSTPAEPFGPGLIVDQVVQMRSTYEILPNQAACAASGAEDRLGFLLIHGLTDSPYLLRSVARSLTERYPCALVRGLLLPGHGTVPGDSLAMQHEEWLAGTRFGGGGFRGQVGSLFLFW